MGETIQIKRALISVSDKTGLTDLVKVLGSFDVDIISTGGTLKAIQDSGVPARSITEVTAFPEILDGRVKTLHPKIHGGLLYLRDKEEHVATVKEQEIEPIDLVVVNLYPFENTVAKPGVSLEEAIENIDIGGPSMLRSGAKNYQSVVVVSDPEDYSELIAELQNNKGSISKETSCRLAVKVYAKTHQYDGAISRFLSAKLNTKEEESTESTLPQTMEAKLTQVRSLRYGENPHQKAALYACEKGPHVEFEQLNGKELSYNNLLDLDAALDILDEFKTDPAACVIKHNNPCGVAEGNSLPEALDKAIDSDPISAFGGIVGLNEKCCLKTVQTLFAKLNFLEIVVAPDFDEDAVAELSKKKNLRVLKIKRYKNEGPEFQMKHTQLGALLQDKDIAIRLSVAEAKKNWKVATKMAPEEGDWSELLFAWKCAKLVKSNAIVLTQSRSTVGIGAGQMSRVDSVNISCQKAGEKTRGSYLGSDAFFPMPDNIEIAAKHGIKAIVQPGGSIKDEDVIKACDEHGIAMVLTGERHFRH